MVLKNVNLQALLSMKCSPIFFSFSYSISSTLSGAGSLIVFLFPLCPHRNLLPTKKLRNLQINARIGSITVSNDLRKSLDFGKK